MVCDIVGLFDHIVQEIERMSQQLQEVKRLRWRVYRMGWVSTGMDREDKVTTDTYLLHTPIVLLLHTMHIHGTHK